MGQERLGASSDVIVCGGGLSGFSAAVTALEAGAAVTLVEKAPEIGGSTVLSTGVVWTFASYEYLRESIPFGDPLLQFLVYDTVADGRNWLARQGVTFGPEESLLGHGRGQIMNPNQAIAALQAKFLELGGTLLVRTPLLSLLEEQGVIVGIRTRRDGQAIEMHSTAVVLATGGFQGNPELLSRYVLADSSNVVLRANPWSTGDGLMAATDAGAAVTSGLGAFYGHALAAPPASYTALTFGDVSQFYGQLAIAINLEGERFADESDGLGEEILNQRLAQQPKGRGYYIVDAKILRARPIDGLDLVTKPMIDRSRDAGAAIIQADTLGELCARLSEAGLPAARVQRTIEEYNRAAVSGEGRELKPPRRRQHAPLAEAPFVAIEVQAAITFTMGGLAIDEEGRVLRRAGSSSPLAPVPETRAFMEHESECLSIGASYQQMSIPGLFAAGCDSGNISHFGYMGGLATALTTGRVAGRSAASFAKGSAEVRRSHSRSGT